MMPNSFILTFSLDSTGTSCMRSADLLGCPTGGPEKAEAAIGTASSAIPCRGSEVHESFRGKSQNFQIRYPLRAR